MVVAVASSAALAIACGSDTTTPSDGGVDMGISETSGNLAAPLDVNQPDVADASSVDANDAADASNDARNDGG